MPSLALAFEHTKLGGPSPHSPEDLESMIGLIGQITGQELPTGHLH